MPLVPFRTSSTANTAITGDPSVFDPTSRSVGDSGLSKPAEHRRSAARAAAIVVSADLVCCSALLDGCSSDRGMAALATSVRGLIRPTASSLRPRFLSRNP
jgi:hypothetical protein